MSGHDCRLSSWRSVHRAKDGTTVVRESHYWTCSCGRRSPSSFILATDARAAHAVHAARATATSSPVPGVRLTPPRRRALDALRGYDDVGRTAGWVAVHCGHDHASNAARVLDALVAAGLARTWDRATGTRVWALTARGRHAADTLAGAPRAA